MPPTIDTQEEQQLIGAVKRANELVDSGLKPDEAIEKVARAEQFGPGKVRLIAHAYNTGRQLHQFNQNQNILDKLASFDLADPERIISRMYVEPEKKAEALPDEYHRPPSWLERPLREKIARAPMPVTITPPEPYQGDRMHQLHKAYGQVQRDKQASDALSRQVNDHQDAVRKHVCELVTYFRKAANDRLSFELVEHAARSYFGNAVPPLMDMIYKQAKLREKRASTQVAVQKVPTDVRQEPFTIIKDCIKSAEAVLGKRQELDAHTKSAAERKEAAFRPFAPAGVSKPQEDKQSSIMQDKNLWGEKAANLLGAPAVGAAVGTMLGRTMGSVPKTKDDLIEDAWLELEDPGHQNELRKIRAHAMLNQLMTDPDDPISGHDPDKVLSAYNEIAQVTPRIAENVATLRPLLRRRLSSHAEPFEAKEMTDIEKGLAQTRMPTPNTSILKDAPEMLLG